MLEFQTFGRMDGHQRDLVAVFRLLHVLVSEQGDRLQPCGNVGRFSVCDC